MHFYFVTCSHGNIINKSTLFYSSVPASRALNRVNSQVSFAVLWESINQALYVVPDHSHCNWQQVQLSLPRFPNCRLVCTVLSAAACLCLRKPEEERDEGIQGMVGSCRRRRQGAIKRRDAGYS
ncbi:hypothetical protein GOODEAATRI_029863 [Goodea atripinnis]|uniref:Uncharacterized protein n=1 Tax=Goodea atripinnis TaxID=208336 RepID=A0ABV0MLV2_9TELE